MRTFIAVELPSRIHGKVAQHQQQLQALLEEHHIQRSICWVAQGNAHLTLRFLGETSQTQCQALAVELQKITLGQKQFDLALGQIGCFPNMKRSRVIWIGIKESERALRALQKEVERTAQQVGFAPDNQRYFPHLTLGRVQRKANQSVIRHLGQVLQQQLDTLKAAESYSAEENLFQVEQITHYLSELRPTGATYQPLQVFPFQL